VNKQEIEALVLRLVDAVLAGKKVEDSLIECKGEWPLPTKARQLAAHANRARGEEVVWIIGLDEKAGVLTSPHSPDLADWWSKMESRFDDHVVPDMRDLRVQVNEEASVTALVFSTDRAPYVVKVADAEGRVEREIPIRDGTRTRSAYRHEIIRLLYPAAVPPPVTLIQAGLTGRSNNGIKSGVVLQFEAHLYIEQRTDETIMVPQHLMDFHLMGASEPDRHPEGEKRIDLKPYFTMTPSDNDRALGVNYRLDGITVTGGAVVDFRAHSFFEGEPCADYCYETYRLFMSLGVAGASRPIIIEEMLKVNEFAEPSGPVNNLFGRWSLMQD
jgi:hypothetical protein